MFLNDILNQLPLSSPVTPIDVPLLNDNVSLFVLTSNLILTLLDSSLVVNINLPYPVVYLNLNFKLEDDIFKLSFFIET